MKIEEYLKNIGATSSLISEINKVWEKWQFAVADEITKTEMAEFVKEILYRFNGVRVTVEFVFPENQFYVNLNTSHSYSGFVDEDESV